MVVVLIMIMGAAMVEVMGRPLQKSAPLSDAFTVERGLVIQDPTHRLLLLLGPKTKHKNDQSLRDTQGV